MNTVISCFSVLSFHIEVEERNNLFHRRLSLPGYRLIRHRRHTRVIHALQ